MVAYQKLIRAACIENTGGMGLEILTPDPTEAYCDTYARQDQKSHVCELVLYQSLAHDRIESGDGTDATDAWRTWLQKEAAGHDADGKQNGYTAVDQSHPLYKDPDGLMNAIPNRWENYTGDIQYDSLAEVEAAGPYAQFKYGGRAVAGRSVKKVCCS